MNIMAVAFDYDRTLTDESLEISESTAAALRRLRKAGIKTIVVSGRILEFLNGINEKYGIADAIVAENGAVVYFPETGEKMVLGKENAEWIKRAFVRQQGFFVREAIVATTIEHLEEARNLLEKAGISGIAEIELNRKDVMIMPKGVSKESGLSQALCILGIQKENAACIGDAENDIALFRTCAYRAAVANAVELLKEQADFICSKPYGDGVVEFVEKILRDKE